VEKSGYGVCETGSLKSDLQLSYMCHIVSGILGYLAYPFMLFDDTFLLGGTPTVPSGRG